MRSPNFESLKTRVGYWVSDVGNKGTVAANQSKYVVAGALFI